MKVLEIVQKDNDVAPGSITVERVTQITNFIKRLGGLSQNQNKETLVEGDKFENVSQSVIATRESIAKGIIGVRDQKGDEIADALQTLEATLTGDAASELTDDQRTDALELLAELSQQGAKSEASKTVMKSIGTALWSTIENVEPLSKACLAAWSVVEKLWS